MAAAQLMMAQLDKITLYITDKNDFVDKLRNLSELYHMILVLVPQYQKEEEFKASGMD